MVGDWRIHHYDKVPHNWKIPLPNLKAVNTWPKIPGPKFKNHIELISFECSDLFDWYYKYNNTVLSS